MRTLIVQSYRTSDVAPWITDCLRSVRSWAAGLGYAYEFLDDSFFDYAPVWVRKRCGSQILPITDVARLYLLRDRLRVSWDRVVWIDADVLVFAPEKFVLQDAPYGLCFELWSRTAANGEPEFGEAINNAVLQMTPQQPLLDFLIFASEEVLRTRAQEQINTVVVGTRLLSALGSVMPLRVLQNVGLFTPQLVRDIAAGGSELLARWAIRFGRPIGAANLCASMQGRQFSGARVDAADMQRAVDMLLRTCGDVVNVPLLASA